MARGILQKWLGTPDKDEERRQRITRAEARVRRAEDTLFTSLDVKIEQHTERSHGGERGSKS